GAWQPTDADEAPGIPGASCYGGIDARDRLGAASGCLAATVISALGIELGGGPSGLPFPLDHCLKRIEHLSELRLRSQLGNGLDPGPPSSRARDGSRARNEIRYSCGPGR